MKNCLIGFAQKTRRSTRMQMHPGQLAIMKATDGDKVFTITWGKKPMMSVSIRVEDLLDELKEEQYGRG